ncbi:MAG: carboxypeptidase-like regulatory domain-containing protein, partial [Gemmatimonadota bacterium]|nr:carboxypeptidase-like regulatory domain-containing protein [Gemmatimonadota bacterium]
MIALCLPSVVAAQTGQIKGKVLELGTGDPLLSATVQVVGTGFGAVSSNQGDFSISRLPVGNYTLKVSFIGYQPETREATVQQDRTTIVDFQLKSRALEMEAITIYGEMSLGQARAFQEQKLSPNIVNVINAEQFDRFPDRNAAETVQRIPGISITRDQGEGELVQIRGITPDLNSLTLNGQRIPSPDPDGGQRSVGLDLLNSDLIEQITVTKALTPDMDGDALGGVVDFKFKQAPEKTNISFNVAGGFNQQESDFEEYGKELSSLNGHVGGRVADGKLGLLLAGTYYRTNRGSVLQQRDYTDDTGTTLWRNRVNDYDVKRQRYGINFNTDYRFDELNSVFLNFSYNFYKDDEIRRKVEYEPFKPRETREIRNRLEDQRLGAVQFGGEHFLKNAILDYTATWIKSLEDMPDRTYYRYRRKNTDLETLSNDQVL